MVGKSPPYAEAACHGIAFHLCEDGLRRRFKDVFDWAKPVGFHSG